MENTRNRPGDELFSWSDWSKKESEELVLIYLEDYYRTLDDYYLQEAVQIAKDEALDLQKIMGWAKRRMN
ncbi:MAG: hypothetical protein WAN36_02930 [Calditrichia bacterium]